MTGKKNCMLTATFWSAQSNTARELELFFFFRFSQTGLVGTGVHGCRERGALNVWWGHTCGSVKHPCKFMVSIQPQDQNCEKRPTVLFPSAVLCCVVLCCSVASPVREVLAGRCSWGRRFSHVIGAYSWYQAARQPFHILTPIQCNPKVHDEWLIWRYR